MARPKLTILVNFHNMRREAARTLYTLSSHYQVGISPGNYDVIAIDNGSTEPLNEDLVSAQGPNFFHLRFATPSPSPCAAINEAAQRVRSANLMVCIDGARMLTPGVVRYALAALDLHPHPFVYTLGMHLGHRPQNELIDEGYDQAVEDQLLATIPWQDQGYGLFDIGSLALSSGQGYFSPLSESNCFGLRRTDFEALGGLDVAFQSPGGGLANLDFFNRVHEWADIQPVMLLGEASFHQFHGGVATNVRPKDHPWADMADEYARIRAKPYARIWHPPEYYGWLSPRYHARLVSLAAPSQ
jgi:hypothetical protein